MDAAESGSAVVCDFVKDLMDCHEADEFVVGLRCNYPFFGLYRK